jgi:hypothetical protein
MAAKNVKISATGKNHHAVLDDGPAFAIGKEVKYGNNIGLQHLGDSTSKRYSPEEHREEYGFWADFLVPTATCESGGCYSCLNTYDTALFTFGFLQFAAHVPNGDCILYFRRLLALPQAKSYFPDLMVKDGRIRHSQDDEETLLETDDDTSGFQRYFNPDPALLSDEELRRAALCIHWCENDPDVRDLQVAVGVELFKNNMKRYAQKYALDQAPDAICAIVADIRHQGRAKSDAIRQALDVKGRWDVARTNLLSLGLDRYPDRLQQLEATLRRLEDEGIFGRRVYDLASADFQLLSDDVR